MNNKPILYILFCIKIKKKENEVMFTVNQLNLEFYLCLKEICVGQTNLNKMSG